MSTSSNSTESKWYDQREVNAKERTNIKGVKHANKRCEIARRSRRYSRKTMATTTTTTVFDMDLLFMRFQKRFIEDAPSPKGLFLGLFSVAIGQIIVVMYHFIRLRISQYYPSTPIQEKLPVNDFFTELRGHLCRVESFLMVFAYLSLTWMLKLMPSSYYRLDWNEGINWFHVLLQLLVVDFFTWLFHMIEHRIKWLYWFSHKPHHRFTNPSLFDAFNGSVPDTFIMILCPLYITALIVPAGNLSYAAFGTVYAGYFLLIHSEFTHVWDPLFEITGIGTAEDHNVHHAAFVYNFGHFFTYWDRIFGTYKSPIEIQKIRRKQLYRDQLSLLATSKKKS